MIETTTDLSHHDLHYRPYCFIVMQDGVPEVSTHTGYLKAQQAMRERYSSIIHGVDSQEWEDIQKEYGWIAAITIDRFSDFYSNGMSEWWADIVPASALRERLVTGRWKGVMYSSLYWEYHPYQYPPEGPLPRCWVVCHVDRAMVTYAALLTMRDSMDDYTFEGFADYLQTMGYTVTVMVSDSINATT